MAQYASFQKSDFGDIPLHRNDHSHMKINLTFFPCDFTTVTADVITYYIVSLPFPDPQAKFS